MQTTTQTVRAFRPQYILWKWTVVSAVLHALLVGSLCGVSYLGFQKRDAAAKAKVAEQDAVAAKAEADANAKVQADAAKAGPTNAATPAPSSSAPAPAANVADKSPAPAAPTQPPPIDPNAPIQAEKVLGIDKVAKPGETPKSPFAGKDDDLLKDLK